jgi:hypothetical protein
MPYIQVTKTWSMRILLLIAVLFFSAVDLFAQTGSSGAIDTKVFIQGGVGLGTVIAVVISWSRHESIRDNASTIKPS